MRRSLGNIETWYHYAPLPKGRVEFNVCLCALLSSRFSPAATPRFRLAPGSNALCGGASQLCRRGTTYKCGRKFTLCGRHGEVIYAWCAALDTQRPLLLHAERCANSIRGKLKRNQSHYISIKWILYCWYVNFKVCIHIQVIQIILLSLYKYFLILSISVFVIDPSSQAARHLNQRKMFVQQRQGRAEKC